MKSKKGISLIVLVITIIIVIILAGAVILSLSNNNPVENASKAKVVSDIDTFKSELTVYIGNQYAKTSGMYDISTLNGKSESDLEEIITSMNNQKIGNVKYSEVLTIQNGELVLKDGYEEKVDTASKETLEAVVSSSSTPAKPFSFVDANGNGEYDLFEIVTCGSETFYVIPNNGGTSSDKVTLLSAKVIDTTTLEQCADLDYYSKAIPFSNTNYWAKDWVEGTRIDLNTYTIPATSPVKGGDGDDKNDYDAGGTEIAVEAYAIKAARDYGANFGGTGRLMTYEEAVAIQNDLESNQEILSSICPERRRLLAWFDFRVG